MYNVVSFSGGKDSTAMLLRMIDEDMPIDEIIFIDTTMEFPGMYAHIDKVEKYIDRKITKLSFDYRYYLGEHQKRNGNIGYGWPDFRNRWCTALKRDISNKYLSTKGNIIEYQGIAKDEPDRINKNSRSKHDIRYPLVEWGMTELECLFYCYEHGFTWNGLYEHFDRVSCYCCPMSRIKELKVVYDKYPLLWENMRQMDSKSFRRFRNDYSIKDLEDKFELINRQSYLF